MLRTSACPSVSWGSCRQNLRVKIFYATSTPVAKTRTSSHQHNKRGALIARQRARADSISLNAIASPAAREPSLGHLRAVPDGGEG